MSTLYLLAAGAASVASATTSSVSAAATSTAATGTLESIVTTIVPSIVASALPSAVTTTTPVTAQPLFLPVWFEIAATFAGALAGGMTAVRLRFDITGLVVLAVVNGLGGGIIRDVLLQDYGIFALDQPRALLAVLAAAAVATFFYSGATKLRPGLAIIEAFSLALFCLVGSDKALVAGLTMVPAIMLGTVTAVGGGMLRDVLCDREPEILRRGSLSATAAVAGSTTYVVLATWLNIAKGPAMIAAAIVAMVLRVGSLWLGWESPEPVDLTPVVTAMPGRVVRGGASIFRRTARRGAHVEESDDDVADSCPPPAEKPGDGAGR